MLAEYSLDDESFQEIMEDAKNMVASIYPEWTDYNYHDPGITMLELLAWIKEGQQFFLDQIGDAHLLQYLKLLGCRPKHSIPASVDVELAPVDEVLPVGMKFYANDVCFENKEKIYASNMLLRGCFCVAGEELLQKRGPAQIRNPLHICMFDEQSKAGDCFYFMLRDGAPMDEIHGLSFHFEQKADCQRNRIEQGMPYPLLEYVIEAYTRDGFVPVELIRDETCGFLQDGIVFIRLSEPMVQTELFGIESYFLRIRLRFCELDAPVLLDRIRMNVLHLTQRDTWVTAAEFTAVFEDGRYQFFSENYLDVVGRSEIYAQRDGSWYPIPVHKKYVALNILGKMCYEFLPMEWMRDGTDVHVLLVSDSENPDYRKVIADGNGFPFQEYDMHLEHVLWDSVRILVQEGAQGGYKEWKLVEDFSESTQSDRHFVIDEDKGTIRFGDCICGMAPEGEILLISMAKTLGELGNVKAHRMNQMMGMLPGEIILDNSQEAQGGKARESIQDCYLTARRSLKSSMTAVTDEDYERYIRSTPGLIIDNCKVASITDQDRIFGQKRDMPNVRHVIVKPGGRYEDRKLSEIYKKNILHHMEQYRLIGSQIVLHSPEYVEVELCVDLVIKPYYVNAKQLVEQTVERFFENYENQFGKMISYSELYGTLDILVCVEQINEIAMDLKKGRAMQGEDGSIYLPPNGMIRLKHADYMYTVS